MGTLNIDGPKPDDLNKSKPDKAKNFGDAESRSWIIVSAILIIIIGLGLTWLMSESGPVRQVQVQTAKIQTMQEALKIFEAVRQASTADKAAAFAEQLREKLGTLGGPQAISVLEDELHKIIALKRSDESINSGAPVKQVRKTKAPARRAKRNKTKKG